MMIVEVNFKSVNEGYKLKLKALHNGAHEVEKETYSSANTNELFEKAKLFIERHGADRVSMKRGYIEDLFAKHLQQQGETGKKEELTVIEGVEFNSVSKENQPLLADLKVYKDCIHDTIRHEDYTSMILQGVLYEATRIELERYEGVKIPSFKYEVELPIEAKPAVLESIIEVNTIEKELGSDEFKVLKHKNTLKIIHENYQLKIIFTGNECDI